MKKKMIRAEGETIHVMDAHMRKEEMNRREKGKQNK